jgi:hypothetical protein
VVERRIDINGEMKREKVAEERMWSQMLKTSFVELSLFHSSHMWILHSKTYFKNY